ncbi:hypothetical protein ABD07_00450 [Nitrosomonas oligotropha]|nr:hypothetical protein [Nitrosomonas oligotropha]
MEMNNMPIKDPTTWSLATWALVIIVGMMGGMVRWLRSVKYGHPRAFNWFEGAIELLTSAFISVLTVLGVTSLGFDLGIAAALGGVASHYGIRSIYLAQDVIKKKVSSIKKQ